MNLITYDPFRELRSLQDEVNRVFSSSMNRSGETGFARSVKTTGKHAIYFVLERSKLAKWVICDQIHCRIPPKLRSLVQCMTNYLAKNDNIS